MGQIMWKDVIVRFLLSAFIGSLVSGGILYFAFDQSMRGLETAVETTNSRIGDIDNDITQVSARIASQSQKMDENHTELTARLAQIATGISQNERNLKGVWMSAATIQGWQQKVNSELLSANIATSDAIELLTGNSNQDPEFIEEMGAILNDLSESQRKVNTLASRDGSQLWINVGPIDDLSSLDFRNLLQEIEKGQ